MCLVYLGTGFITNGSLHSAVSESLGQNSKDCVVNMSGIQSITIKTVVKILKGASGTQSVCIMLESLNNRNSSIMNDISVAISIIFAHNQTTTTTTFFFFFCA